MTNPIFSVELELGRVYATSAAGLSDLNVVRQRLALTFADDDDRERLPLLKSALALSSVRIDAYRGEEAPYEIHTYLAGAGPEGRALFACVLLPPASLSKSLDAPNAVVFESATLQIIDDVSGASIVAGLERWCRRVWPGLKPPAFLVSPWPSALDGGDGAVELLTLFPIGAGDERIAEAFAESDTFFAPPSGLVRDAA